MPTATAASKPKRIVFMEHGKGGVGRTEIAINLATWYQRQGLKPRFIDFDTEDNARGGFKSFIPDVAGIDIHAPGALDHFYEVCDTDDRVLLADMGAGSVTATREWLTRNQDTLTEMNIRITAVGVATNDPGAITTILQWAAALQNSVDYLVVLNPIQACDQSFEYWHEVSSVKDFVRIRKPHVIQTEARIAEFQGELRNLQLTLDDVAEQRTDSPFFKPTRQIVRAKRYLSNLYTAFETASDILVPVAGLRWKKTTVQHW